MARPRLTGGLKRNAGISLSAELIRVLDSVKGQESRSRLVERVLRELFNLPDIK